MTKDCERRNEIYSVELGRKRMKFLKLGATVNLNE